MEVANDSVITISTVIVVVWCNKASCSPARVLRQVALVHPVGRLVGSYAPANATSVCNSCGLAMQLGGRPNVRQETPAVAALRPWAAGCASWLARVTLQHAEVGIVEPVPRRFARRVGRVSWLEVLCARRVRGLVAKPQAWLARLRPLPKGGRRASSASSLIELRRLYVGANKGEPWHNTVRAQSKAARARVIYSTSYLQHKL